MSSVDLEGLLCAIVLVPESFSRNRFYALFEAPGAMRIRRRAGRVRSIVRQLSGLARTRAEIVGEQVLEDGQVILRYRIEDLNYERTAALTALEAAVLRYALAQSGRGDCSQEDKDLVEAALARLGPGFSPLDPKTLA
jgi:hypothetical protein